MKQGDVFTTKFTFSQGDVETFARATGDYNPLHLDAEYAAGTAFKKPIMHGILGASLFSKVFGMEWPGAGTVYLKQTLEFKRPMFVDTEYEAVCTVTAVDEAKHAATIKTDIKDAATGKLCTTGEAGIMNAEKI